MLIGGALNASLGFPMKKSVHNVALGVAVAGMCQVAMGAHHFAVPLVAALVIGLTSPWLNTPVETIWMRMTPEQLQGRVLSTEGLIGQLTYPVGLYLVSVLGDFMTPSALFVWSGIGLGLGTFLWVFNPALRSIDEEPDAQATAVEGAVENAT
jgi:DHA3 family macrolide efflux protein-like MFS transporter